MRRGRDVVVALHEREAETAATATARPTKKSRAPQHREHEQREHKREQSSARMREEQRGVEQRARAAAPTVARATA